MDDQPSPAPGVPNRMRRRLYSGALVLLALVFVLVALLYAALRTEAGARAVWQLVTRAMPGTLSGDFVSGTISDGVQLRNVTYRDAARQIKINTLKAGWNLSRAPLKLTVNYLHIGTVDATLLPTPPKPLEMPRQITLPVAIDARNATLQQVVIRRDANVSTISDIRLSASSDRVRHMLTLEHADTPLGTARATLRLNGKPPFETAADASLDGVWQEERYRLDAQIAGTLQALDVHLEADGDRLNGSARLEAAPFEEIPLRRAQLRLRHLNPQLFNAGAPRADLDIGAALAPVGGTPESAQDLSSLVVAGPVSLTNAIPGPIDKGLLPVASAKADLMLDIQHQQLSRLLVRLADGGRLEGGGEFHKAGNGYLTLQASRLDLHALHTRLKPSQLSGPLRAETANGTQRLTLKLADTSIAIAADAEFTARQIALKSAQLEAGAAQLQIGGTMQRDEQRAFEVKGKLTDFNPAQFFVAKQRAGSTTSGKAPDARINTDFEAHGALHPELNAQLQFDVHDSMYADLPMTGAGTLSFAGARLLAGDAQLSVAGNHVQLKGSFGTPPERLKFSVDAPALNRLGFGLSGLVQADGELGGTLERPAIDASYRAEQLAYEQNRLAHLSGQIHTQGVPGRDPDAQVTLALDARGIQSGDINLANVNAAVKGSYASHTIALGANGQLRGRPLALQLSAQGRLQEQPQGYAWDGRLNTLENRGFPRLSMTQPLTVTVAPKRVALGTTRLTLEQAQIELKSLRIEERLISSEGVVNALDVGHLLELQREITGKRIPLKTDLVLDGRWNLSLAASAEGFFQIERRRGDIRVASGPRESALGIRTLQLRADFQGQQIRLDAQANAARIGSVNGQGELALLPVDGRLLPLPESLLNARIKGEIPQLRTIASLAGPKIALDGSIVADLSASGTLGAPLLSGDVIGKNLSVTLYDQGVHMHDGNAQIRLDNNLIELRRFELRGGEGTLRATGRIPLGGDNPEMTAAIVADHLQLLSTPSGQMTISGQANAAMTNGQLEITGKVRADNAHFRLAEKSAPALDDDVVVIRGKERIPAPANRAAMLPASERPAGSLTPRVALDFDLGDDFRFTGSGADVLLGGTLAIASAPGEPAKATGTVRIVEGTYEAFGTKLTIERGLLNFHNSFANPDVNILAMRRDKEVAAGVNVTGTVRQPRVQLVSEPDLPEEEKLSWLVFGRSGTNSEAGSGAAQVAAREAALGVFNRFGGSRVAKGFGLSQLAVGSSEYGLGAQQVVSLGKEISNRLTVGYEQSLSGAAGVLKLTYEWTRHWSVAVRGGTIGGVDVLYNNRFDTGKAAENR